jgi:hypothetical protein
LAEGVSVSLQETNETLKSTTELMEKVMTKHEQFFDEYPKIVDNINLQFSNLKLIFAEIFQIQTLINSTTNDLNLNLINKIDQKVQDLLKTL